MTVHTLLLKKEQNMFSDEMNAALEDVMREVVKLTEYIQSLDSQITQTEAYRILVTVMSKYKQKCDRNPQAAC